VANPPFLFDEESAGRVIRAVRQVEGALQPARPQRGGGDAGADGGGYYPAVITRLNTSDQSYTDFAGCNIVSPNAEVLTIGNRYAVKPVGSYTPSGGSAAPAYEVLGAGAGPTYVNVTTGGPDGSGYYPGTADTYAAGVWTTGPAVRVKNINGDALATGYRVTAYPAGVDGSTAAYLTEAGGFTGTRTTISSVTCGGDGSINLVSYTDTYVNGVLITSA
jgi:hypothetical protein